MMRLPAILAIIALASLASMLSTAHCAPLVPVHATARASTTSDVAGLRAELRAVGAELRAVRDEMRTARDDARRFWERRPVFEKDLKEMLASSQAGHQALTARVAQLEGRMMWGAGIAAVVLALLAWWSRAYTTTFHRKGELPS